jgi:DNA primase small subunit
MAAEILDSNVKFSTDADGASPGAAAEEENEDDNTGTTTRNDDETAATTTTTATSTTSHAENVMMDAVVTPIKAATGQEEHVFSPELLKLYYARLFPYSLLCDWLSYSCNNSSNKVFTRREFSFTLEPIPGEEIYIRYQSFTNAQELEKAIQRRQPRKIDIGAVFTHPPKDKQAYDPKLFHPVQRELVFDIDLTDYDDIRRCGCTGAKICSKCWTYMTMAVQVMDQGLKEDFGFEHVAWFYSGRRGVHAWVCDEEARMLSNEARSAVANYFEVSVFHSLLAKGVMVVRRFGKTLSGVG